MIILFVCTANITRSAMAEAIFRHVVAHHAPVGVDGIVVESAGVAALVGEKPDAITEDVCDKHDIDVHGHRARQLTSEMIEGVDVVLCLAEEHKRLILSAYPRFKEKVHLLVEYRRDGRIRNPSVDDPTGRSRRQYLKCYKRIEEESARIVRDLVTQYKGAVLEPTAPL